MSLKAVSGMALLEILIALLVLSLGLLGTAHLQLQALRGGRNAELRTQAAFLARDMAERLRANPSVADNGGYDTAIGAAVSAPVTLCDAAECTVSQMAAYDLYRWKNSLLNRRLPSGDGSVERLTTGASYRDYLVTVQWSGQGGESQQFALRIRIMNSS